MSRNQREGRYMGRLAASYGQSRLHFRSHLSLPPSPMSAAIALLARSSWLMLAGSMPGWRLASPRRTKLSRNRRKGRADVRTPPAPSGTGGVEAPTTYGNESAPEQGPV